MADYTPEGRSIAVLAKDKYGLRERSEGELQGASSWSSPRRPG
jgi:K+-transporting ATPase ATPase B chain